MNRKEQFQAAQRRNVFNAKVNRIALQLGRDIVAAKREFAPFGSEAMRRQFERSNKRMVLIIAIAREIRSNNPFIS